MSTPWLLGDGDKTVGTQTLRSDYIYDQLAQKLALAGIVDQASFSAFAQYLGFSSGSSSVQDMQVAWEPTTLKLGEMLGFFTFGDVPGITKIQFLGTTSVAGFDIELTTTITELDFPNLVSIDPGNIQNAVFVCSNNSGLISLSLPMLVSVISELDCEHNTSLTTLSLPQLSSVGSNFKCNYTLLSSLTLPSLASVGNEFWCQHNPAITSIDLPLLVSVSGRFDIEVNPLLTNINVASLTTVGGAFDCDTLAVLANLSLPSLTSVGSSFQCTFNPSLASLNVPSLITVSGNTNCFTNPFLVTLDVSSWIPNNGTVINFTGNALNATSIELILRRCVLAAVTTCTIDLSGGTNAGVAALNAQGQADVATLGAQLTINP